MATRDAKLKIAIEGEQQYKQAVAELNRGNQVLNAEMKKLQEQYKGSESSMEAMRAKSDLLQRQLLQQKDKVQTLREALQKAAQQYGEADKRTQSWQTQLLNAERDEIKLQRALDETNKEINSQGTAMEEAGEKTKGLGDSLDSVASKLGISIPSAAKDALNGINGFSVGTVAVMGAAAAGIASVYKAASALHDLTKEAAKEADALVTRSSQTGLDMSLLQGLDYAAKFLDFEGIDKSLVKLTDSMDKARHGAKDQADAFATLGVSIYDTDGNLRSNWDTFLDVIDALGKVENATERDVLASDLLGKSYSELKPLIEAGSEALIGYINEAIEAGFVMRDDQVEALTAVDDAARKFDAQMEAAKNKLALEFAPVSEQVMKDFGNFIYQAATDIAESGVIGKLGEFLEPLKGVYDTLINLLEKALPYIPPLLDSLSNAFGTAADAAKSAYEWTKDFFNTLQEADSNWQLNDSMGYYVDDYNPAFGSLDLSGKWKSYNEVGKEKIKSMLGNSTVKTPTNLARNAAGDDSWRGGLTWVGDGGGPELVDLPRGTRIYSAQESRQIAAASVDTRRMETLLERSVALQERIYGEFSGLRVKGRMAM